MPIEDSKIKDTHASFASNQFADVTFSKIQTESIFGKFQLRLNKMESTNPSQWEQG
jgi:hypothetical protein